MNSMVVVGIEQAGASTTEAADSEVTAAAA